MLPDPSIIPNSKAIKRVPAPTPLLCSGERSAFHAKRVGLLIPVAIPKIIAATVNITISVERASNTILISIILIPIRSVFLLPIRSDKLLANKRTKIVERT